MFTFPRLHKLCNAHLPEEEKLYESIDFDCESYKKENKISSNKLLHEDKKSLLMARWRYPTLSLHGIEGAFAGVGARLSSHQKCLASSACA